MFKALFVKYFHITNSMTHNKAMCHKLAFCCLHKAYAFFAERLSIEVKIFYEKFIFLQRKTDQRFIPYICHMVILLHTIACALGRLTIENEKKDSKIFVLRIE